MITSFDDFCLFVYVTIDDLWPTIAHYFKRPGPPPVCSDSELLTMILVGECRGWDKETDMLQHWQAYRYLFPHLPSQSRFNRRRRQLQDALQLIRIRLLRELDLTLERLCAIDSQPLPVVAFHHAPRASWQWPYHEANIGKAISKGAYFYGYRLHLLVTLEGLILDYEVAAAAVRDLPVAEEMLANHADLTVLGDKNYIHQGLAEQLRAERGIELLTLPRKNQRVQLPQAFHYPFKAARQIIETVNSQLCEQFNIQRNHARSFAGFAARIHAKLAAHTLGIYLNRLLGVPAVLQIKHLSFPN
jgi:hypothetical protein